jgi:hypothetical protein
MRWRERERERERGGILRVVTFYIHRERGECGSERERLCVFVTIHSGMHSFVSCILVTWQ